MAKKRYYAVKSGIKTGIFNSWDECKGFVSGYPNAEYKGFATLDEANNYMNNVEEKFTHSSDSVIAYVDGSFDADNMTYSYGCVIILPDGSIKEFSGQGNNKENAKLRNVTGEMLGAMRSVRFAINNGYKAIEIRYDYAGIEQWVVGNWNTKSELTKKYADAMKKWKKDIKICFTKVAAHTNVKYNERADQLAKQALRK
jgi:ribonuclease HI